MTDRPQHGALDYLISRSARLVATATDALEAAWPDGVADWQQELGRVLARYGAAAFMAGAGVEALSPAASAAVRRALAEQLGFLAQFAVEVQGAAAWQRSWNARAQMYAESIKNPYWQGKTKLLPLPAMPGDGSTQCLTRCKCLWDIAQLEGDENYDCTWVISAVEHCQTCRQRAETWAPLQIRGGELQL